MSRYFRNWPEQDQLLPTPPGRRERKMYLQRQTWWLVPMSLVSFTCITISQVLFGLSHPALFVFLPLTAFTIVYYLISLAVNIGPRDFDFKEHTEIVDVWLEWAMNPKSRVPSIDIFLPICGEDFELIANTWKYVSELSYRADKLTVYVLNDGPDGVDEKRLRALAHKLGFVYMRRPLSGRPYKRGRFKKAGNLLFGFDHSKGDYIMIFDADFVPASDMLHNLAAYLYRDRTLGIVQSPQWFRTRNHHMNWLERGAGAVQEWFYRLSQTSRNHWGSAICVGTCAMYRRAALDANDGPTQIGHSEDVHTGFDLRRKGWGLLYIPVALSTGVCPSVRSSFLAQQYRWCMGSMSLLTSRKFWETKMSLRARAGYLSGFCYYLHTAILTFAAPIIPLVLLTMYPEMVFARNYVLILPSLVYTLIAVPWWHRNQFGVSALAVKMIYGWAHFFALLDLIRGKQKGWQPTGNTGSTRGMLDRHFYKGTIGWGCTSAMAWIALAVWRIATSQEWTNFLPILVSGLFYAVVVGKTLTKTEATKLPELDGELIMTSRIER